MVKKRNKEYFKHLKDVAAFLDVDFVVCIYVLVEPPLVETVEPSEDFGKELQAYLLFKIKLNTLDVFVMMIGTVSTSRTLFCSVWLHFSIIFAT